MREILYWHLKKQIASCNIHWRRPRVKRYKGYWRPSDQQRSMGFSLCFWVVSGGELVCLRSHQPWAELLMRPWRLAGAGATLPHIWSQLNLRGCDRNPLPPASLLCSAVQCCLTTSYIPLVFTTQGFVLLVFIFSIVTFRKQILHTNNSFSFFFKAPQLTEDSGARMRVFKFKTMTI